jgi:predicted DNA-binding protein
MSPYRTSRALFFEVMKGSSLRASARATTIPRIRLAEDLIEALDQEAAALGITRSQLIIEAVEQALAEVPPRLACRSPLGSQGDPAVHLAMGLLMRPGG